MRSKDGAKDSGSYWCSGAYRDLTGTILDSGTSLLLQWQYLMPSCPPIRVSCLLKQVHVVCVQHGHQLSPSEYQGTC